MTTVIYASVLSLIICWLALNVIKLRRKHKVRYDDGDVKELQIARAAHSNAVDTIPLTLILLFALEFNGGSLWLVHLCGIALLFGRFVHCHSILKDQIQGRALGMKITFTVIVALAISNLIYLPYNNVLP